MKDTLAKIITVIFHPLLMPLYGLLIIFSAPTLLGFIPFVQKKVIILILLTNNILLPLSLLPYMKWRKIISTWSLSDRNERIIPMALTSLFYFVTLYIVLKYSIPVFIKAVILSTALLSFAITLINFWWKISIHSAGAGALLSLVIILSVKMSVPLTWFLLPVILATGLVLSSRLWLNSHNPEEVWSGLLLGSICTSLFLLFF